MCRIDRSLIDGRQGTASRGEHGRQGPVVEAHTPTEVVLEDARLYGNIRQRGRPSEGSVRVQETYPCGSSAPGSRPAAGEGEHPRCAGGPSQGNARREVGRLADGTEESSVRKPSGREI